MEKLELNTLVQIAKACRKAGIRSFKGFGVEFTLDDNFVPPTRKARSAKAQVKESGPELKSNGPVESDELSPDALLFWSTGEGDGAAKEA